MALDSTAIAWLFGGIAIGGTAASIATQIWAKQASRLAELERREQQLKAEREITARVDQDAAALESQRVELRAQKAQLDELEASLHDREARIAAGEQQISEQLQNLTGLSAPEAEAAYLARFERNLKEHTANMVRDAESQTNSEIEAKARQTLLQTLERKHVEFVVSATTATIPLPNEEMKGRIIGRDGRNIRTFEQVVGVDLLVDDKPNTVVISSFDPVRREIARLVLMNLILDGRIHPGRIEELYEAAQTEIQTVTRESGAEAAALVGVAGIPGQAIEIMGALRFRTSYGQNVLSHSVETAQIAYQLAADLGINAEVARLAGFLHDIGKALPSEWEGPHAIAGKAFLDSLQVSSAVTHAVGAHHREIEPQTPEAQVVILADSISAARPGARRESLENHMKRLGDLEKIALTFRGVERAVAVQAGREVRVIVHPNEIDDSGAARLAMSLARKIEQELEYPGQIKITVIRETRAQGIAN